MAAWAVATSLAAATSTRTASGREAWLLLWRASRPLSVGVVVWAAYPPWNTWNGSVSYWLLLLPLSAVPPLVADRFAKRVTRTAEDGMADDRRLAATLVGLATDAESAGGIRA